MGDGNALGEKGGGERASLEEREKKNKRPSSNPILRFWEGKKRGTKV